MHKLEVSLHNMQMKALGWGGGSDARLKVLAVDALAVVGAEDGGLEALAILLQAAALLAVAPLVVARRCALNRDVSSFLHSTLHMHAKALSSVIRDPILIWCDS